MCSNCEEGCECNCEGYDYPMMLVHSAKMDLIKEKLKAKLEEKYGEQLDRIASLIVDVLVARTKQEGEIEKKEAELEEALEEIGLD